MSPEPVAPHPAPSPGVTDLTGRAHGLDTAAYWAVIESLLVAAVARPPRRISRLGLPISAFRRGVRRQRDAEQFVSSPLRSARKLSSR